MCVVSESMAYELWVLRSLLVAPSRMLVVWDWVLLLCVSRQSGEQYGLGFLREKSFPQARQVQSLFI
ncbi:hypothetical protein X922_17775 [Pseudomonas aeruginosa VRFPA08]|nr:hypothetical protein X922_17775 [Pseudomonas aeruginosa VRFPA08]